MSGTIGAILPKGKTQFFDANGTPLASGQVSFYIPETTTQLTTYQDQALTIPNDNPVILDGSGEAIIWGYGSFRQIVQDSNGNTIWDEVVSAPPVPVYGIDTGAANDLTVSIDGVSGFYTGMQLVVIPLHSNTGPTTLTLNSLPAVNVTLGGTALGSGAIAAGVAAQMVYDGTNLQLLNTQVPPTSNAPGDLKAIAGATAPAGWDLCYGKTYSRTINAALFAAIGTAWGAGDGSTTFLGPDLRGRGLFGADAMGGTPANRLTSASMGVTAAVGAVGGDQEVQTHSHTPVVTDNGHAHSVNTAIVSGNVLAGSGTGYSLTSTPSGTAATGITVAIANYGTGGSQNVPPAAVINWIMYVG